ncbi:hypothetical protein GIB67_030644 [Kingdonia uniflora]|uniref:Uncharacterized protein n=1 Tax=Kingdonia uniflora TaxID=39325 RepID=A0A7J7NI69_9MAGN|nr:hypothetical protein GIB67_030644 [Kingdonia uniflora]
MRFRDGGRYRVLDNSNKVGMADVSIVCKRTVVSTKAVQPGQFYQLSVLDRIMEPNNIRMVYYYRFPSETTELGSVTKKLRELLSEVLTSYSIVTGRLQKNPDGEWMVKCNDAGVRMIEATAKGSVDKWLQTADREKELNLIYWEEMFHKPYFWSTFYVQLTEFEQGGVAIGLSCTHLLADATSATMLIKSWAETSLLGKMTTPPQYQPLPSPTIGKTDDTHNDLINHYKSSMNSSYAPRSTRHVTITFKFTDAMVIRLSEDALPGTRILNATISTPFAALSGLMWVSISHVKGMRNRFVDLSLSLDVRPLLGLLKGFFGNCTVFSKVCQKDDGLYKVDLANATEAIVDSAAKLTEEEIIAFIKWLESNILGHKQPHYPPINGPELICANLESLDPFSAMFDSWLEPLRVSYYLEHVFGQGQVLILPSPRDEGSSSRIVMVTLPEDEAVKLCEHDLILKYSPTILMGGHKK